MADEATQEVQDTSSAEATAAESQTEQKATGNETQDAGNQTGDQSKQDANASTGEQKPSAQDAKTEQKPQSRRSAQFRIQELVRENKELRQQQNAPKQAAVDEWGNPIEPTEDKPDPRYTKLEAEIEALKGLVKPVMTNSQKAADDGELSELFTGKPEERAKYEESIRRMWELPQYKDLAAQDLYKIATFDDAIANAKAQAVEEYKQAVKEAKESSASGSSNTSNRTGNSRPIANMSDDELLAHNERVKAGTA